MAEHIAIAWEGIGLAAARCCIRMLTCQGHIQCRQLVVLARTSFDLGLHIKVGAVDIGVVKQQY